MNAPMNPDTALHAALSFLTVRVRKEGPVNPRIQPIQPHVGPNNWIVTIIADDWAVVDLARTRKDGARRYQVIVHDNRTISVTPLGWGDGDGMAL